MANILADRAGYQDYELPYATLSTPPEYTDTHIDFGFDKAVPIQATARRMEDMLLDREDPDSDEEQADDDDMVEPEDRFTGDVAETPVVDTNWRILPNETTMQAFERLTHGTPWTPFWKQGTKSALEEEELAVFEAMHVNYDINLAPRHPSGKGYQSFESAWNQEVARRFQINAEGEEGPLQLIKRKNVQQLREQYERRRERLGTASLADRARDEHNHAMNSTLQDVRRSLPAYAAATAHARPVQYPQVDGNMPAGMPMALNAEIVYGPMHNNGRGALPWAFNQALTTVATPLANMPPVVDLTAFKRRKYCLKCGWKRRMHTSWNCTFGEQCTMTLCGKCYLMKEHHTGGFGTQCMNETNDMCAFAYSDWFEVGAQPTTQPIQGDNGVEEIQGDNGVEEMQTGEI